MIPSQGCHYFWVFRDAKLMVLMQLFDFFVAMFDLRMDLVKVVLVAK